jgi:small subunit ribosomal protein S4
VVNGNVVNIPSYLVKPGDLIGVRERSKGMEEIRNSMGSRRGDRYEWLELNSEHLTGKFLNRPEREEIPENIKEQLIVELYSK